MEKKEKNEGFGVENSLRKENRTLGAGGTIINELHPCHKSLKKRGEKKPGFKKKKKSGRKSVQINHRKKIICQSGQKAHNYRSKKLSLKSHRIPRQHTSLVSL